MERLQKLLNEISANIDYFISFAQSYFYSFTRYYSSSLRFNFYLEPQQRSSEFLEYIDNFWLAINYQNPVIQDMNIFIANHTLLVKTVASIVKNNVILNTSYQRFIFNQKIIAIQNDNISLFYPIVASGVEYPIFLKIDNNFFIINYKVNDYNKEFLFRLIKEIYISYFEADKWITYHGNSILLPNHKAAIIMGLPNVGKTTLSTGLCYKGNSLYISDDRIMVKNAQSIAIPSAIYLDIKMIVKLKMESILSNNDIKITFPRTKIPIRLINKVNLFEHGYNLDDFLFKIGLFIIPQFNLNIDDKFYLHDVNEEVMINLLMNNCLSSKEIWRDQYMFNRYETYNLLMETCNAQIKNIIKNHKTLQIEFGPNVDYSILEEKICNIEH